MNKAKLNPILPLPSFYDKTHASQIEYAADQQKLFETAQGWKREHAIPMSGPDKFNIHLLGIDLQKDFCFPEGSLYVGGRSGKGAIEDNDRIARFIYQNLGRITQITMTMDTHFAFQIFFASFWVDKDGNPLQPFREISADDISGGAIKPNPDMAWWLCDNDYGWLLKQVAHYCRELEKAGKYKLYLWPPHAVVGSPGHALAGVIHEARMFHSFVRGVQSWTEIKGEAALTENYSVLRPEVLTRFDGRSFASKNTRLLDTLMKADALIILGQAASHCIKHTIDDLLDEIRDQDPRQAGKVYILTDCMSAVAVPDGKGGFISDYTPQVEAAFDRYKNAGIHLVTSDMPLEEWPGAPWAD